MLYLVIGQNSERVNDLFGCVRIRALARHKVEEGVKGYESGAVGVDECHNAPEVIVTLSVIANIVSNADQARLELIRVEASSAALVKVIERRTELVQLLLCDAL